MLWGLEYADWLNLIVILIGPLIGVFLGARIQISTSKKDRKLNIYRTLMKTRKEQIHPEHVGALNLIEVEFHGNKKIIKSYHDYLKNLSIDFDKLINEGTQHLHDQEAVQAEMSRINDKLTLERQSLLSDLLSKISVDLSIPVNKEDILRGAYTPIGLQYVQNDQMIIRQYFKDLYNGHRVVPVSIIEYTGEADKKSDQK
tara:strand:- start:330 stop:929 length:600 start_codon:yes stop_codon:yes gene_type:complete